MTPSRPRVPPGRPLLRPAALTATDLTCGVDGHPILSGVDLNVPPGSMLAVVGQNGSGKSTLLRAIAGLTAALHGHIQVDGVDLRRLSARARAQTIAWVGQEDSPAEELLVWQAVALGLVPYQRPWAGTRAGEQTEVRAALDQVGLADLADRRCDALSGGERRRVMLARGLVQRTGVMILDEPTNHLDVAHQLELLQVVRDSGRTVIASLHDLALARFAFDHAVVLHGGRVLAVGPVTDVLVPAVITAAFDVAARLLPDPVSDSEHLVLRPLTPATQNPERSELP